MWQFLNQRSYQDIYLLIAGQSNACGYAPLTGAELPHSRVKLFGNDYVLKLAVEPLDSNVGQVDAVSADASAGAGFALRAGKDIAALSSRYRVILIPGAKGSTQISNWLPAANHLDRTTLYGSLHYRQHVAAPRWGTLPSAIMYFGHESGADDIYTVADYVADWTDLIAAFRTDYGATTPILFGQIGKNTNAELTHRFNQVAELQRQTEAGSGYGSALAYTHMVVSFDLGLTDNVHFDTYAQSVIGQRMALAFRQHVLGEAIDGTGPRLSGAPTHPGGDKSKIKLDTTQTLAAISANANAQFRVWDDTTEMTVSSVMRDPVDASAILITMSATATGTVTVRYGYGVPTVPLTAVVKNAAALPLPQFGVLTVV
jgi:hypothetical protein